MLNLGDQNVVRCVDQLGHAQRMHCAVAESEREPGRGRAHGKGQGAHERVHRGRALLRAEAGLCGEQRQQPPHIRLLPRLQLPPHHLSVLRRGREPSSVSQNMQAGAQQLPLQDQDRRHQGGTEVVLGRHHQLIQV